MFKVFVIALLLFFTLHADDKKINPLPFEYMNLQYAGEIGFIGVGGGNTFFDDTYDFELYLGFTPRIKGISEVALFSLALKNNYVPYTFKMSSYSLRPYIGIGLLLGANHRYNPNWQDNVEKNYYYQNNWHITANLGVVVRKKLEDAPLKSLGFYVESTTLDVYVVDYVQNLDALALDDIFSIGFGVRMEF